MAKANNSKEKKYKTQEGEDYEPQAKKKVNPEDIPYPEKGGHTVQQLIEFTPDKRAAVLGEKNADFEKNYLK